MPLRPTNPYGNSKILAEDALRNFDSAGVRSVCLRYFNAAGAAPTDVGIGEAHWPETNLVPRVILAALGYESDIAIFGNDYPTPDGTAVRDYIHVCDLADAHVAALEYLLNGGDSDTLNLGTGQGHSVLEVIENVQRYTGHTLNVRHAQSRPGDIPVMIANAQRAERVLKWLPQFGLSEMISSATDWHNSAFYRNVMSDVMRQKDRQSS
jgi:UDP-glucose 4-epimerase